ncbi:uncharacterized protein J4E87_006176 [Alternaria ethzedia]|uniref:uncharacterized protein n=1 Tax=Alternaria ethzedia TaxID=181014 RepID=UPI0020C571A9|nr:uncharacterized protein J4E87_006176 [Alternaria ethzedia]KAI4622609.1 hypothetical protein J4E87_006176 [Alternaria ethzedia]
MDVVEITVLLRVAWSRGLDFEIRLIDMDDVGVEGEKAEYWMGNFEKECSKKIISVVNALLAGQLGLREKSDAVRAVAVKKDGSGGLISPAGDSKPIDPSRHSLIKLPAEIRNKIYGYLVEYPEQIVIDLDLSPARDVYKFYLGAGFEMPRNLFLACRTTYLEAASLFYASNTFVIVPANLKNRGTIEYLLGVYTGWLRKLGSQVYWHHKFSIDLSQGVLDRRISFRLYNHQRPEAFNIGNLVHFVWEYKLNIDITFTNTVSANDRRRTFDPATITAITKSILEGQLMIKASRNHIGTVAIDYDGTGGTFGWRKAIDFDCWPRVITPDHDQYHSFIAEDGGRKLALVRHKPALVGPQGS